MNSKELEAHKLRLRLTNTQREILVGLILGDGHLETRNGRTYRLKVEHSIKQKEYVDWLYKNFVEWINQPPKARIKESFGKEVDAYGFTTYSSGTLRFYAQKFYFGKNKVLPKMIGKMLTPLSLAIWFMDDGSYKSDKHRTYIIHSLGYKKEELMFVVDAFKKKFGINAGLHKQYHKWRIYIYSDSAAKFRELIEPYVIPEMRYKLGNTVPKE